MSILIKGIDMPKNGEMTIAFASGENGENTLALILDTNGKPIEHKGVAEIHTPHGRLIDENELLRHKYGFSQTARTIIKTTDAVIEAEVSE